jgi:Flp pilus assembly pilin Flp
MKVFKKGRKGQVVIEYMLIVALGVIGIIIGTKVFNDMVLNAVSEGITSRVSKHCGSCSR